MEDTTSQTTYRSKRPNYVEGNTVRKLYAAPDIRREEQEYAAAPDIRREEQEYAASVRRRQRRAKVLFDMDLVSLLVYVIATLIIAYACASYLQLKTEVTFKEKELATLKHDLVVLTEENDALYGSIAKTVDLDAIYDVAVNELGMVYPSKEQIITYKSSGVDYVRQYADIPSE